MASDVEVTQAGTVALPRELYDFLMGVGEIDGTSFGEMNAAYPGRFWWRALLRRAEESSRLSTLPERDALREALAKIAEGRWPDIEASSGVDRIKAFAAAALKGAEHHG